MAGAGQGGLLCHRRSRCSPHLHHTRRLIQDQGRRPSLSVNTSPARWWGWARKVRAGGRRLAASLCAMTARAAAGGWASGCTPPCPDRHSTLRPPRATGHDDGQRGQGRTRPSLTAARSGTSPSKGRRHLWAGDMDDRGCPAGGPWPQRSAATAARSPRIGGNAAVDRRWAGATSSPLPRQISAAIASPSAGSRNFSFFIFHAVASLLSVCKYKYFQSSNQHKHIILSVMLHSVCTLSAAPSFSACSLRLPSASMISVQISVRMILSRLWTVR